MVDSRAEHATVRLFTLTAALALLAGVMPLLVRTWPGSGLAAAAAAGALFVLGGGLAALMALVLALMTLRQRKRLRRAYLLLGVLPLPIITLLLGGTVLWALLR